MPRPPRSARSEEEKDASESSGGSDSSSEDSTSTDRSSTNDTEPVLLGKPDAKDGDKCRALASRLRDLVVPEPEPSVLREDKCRGLADRLRDLVVEEPTPSLLRDPKEPKEPARRSSAKSAEGAEAGAERAREDLQHAARASEPEPAVLGKQASPEPSPRGHESPAHPAPSKEIEHIAVEMKPVWFAGETACEEVSSRNSPVSSEPTSSKSPVLAKDLQSLRRLWRMLVMLSFLELCLISGGVVADRFFSPCREVVHPCTNLHDRDCKGQSCRDSAPFWASAWPAASLLFLAIPMRCLLGGTLSSGCSIAIPFLVLVSLAVLGTGAAVLAESVTSGLHYAARCPMQRESSRCTADLCPVPPCRRESDFSPCVCGLLGEAELARALFLQNAPACQPYEWYAQQMGLLEDMVLKYEAFACLAGPLTCTAAAVGGVLLLVQLACFPLLLIGHWGGSEAILVLLGRLDEDVTHEAQFTRVANPSLKSPPLPVGPVESMKTHFAKGYVKAQSEDTSRGSGISQRRPWDGDVSPDCSQ